MTEPETPTPSLPAPAPPPAPTRGSNRGCWLLILGLAVVVLLATFALGLMLWSLLTGTGGDSEGPRSSGGGSVLELSFSAPLSEAPPAVDLGPFFGPPPPSLWGVRRALIEAAGDDDIAAIRLDLGFSTLGWATAQEIAALLDDFRDTGRPVVALLNTDQVNDLDYYLATAADQIWLAPTAASMINGLVSQPQFYRGTLEKLRIEPQVIMYKEYKSAGEQYGNYEMSPYMGEAIEAVLATTDRAFVDRVTARRGIEETTLRQVMAPGMSSARSLIDAGLIDQLGYDDQVRQALVEAAELEDYASIGLNRYLGSLGSEKSGRGPRIAVVFGEGAIVAPRVENPLPLPFFGGAVFSGPVVADRIRMAADDPRVEAIVFRVNSPGGSPVGSDIVAREIDRAREAGKPVVVSMGDVAGSGGYWVAMGADRIVAQPTTITGSIGVVFSKFNLDGFWDWIGTGTATIKTAPNADLFSLNAWGPGDREAVETWMDQVYDEFTGKVAAGRGMEQERVLELARGRIWSGVDAQTNQLVDELGGIGRALELAAELADAEGARPVVYPRPKTLYQQLSESGFTETASAVRSQLGLGGTLPALDQLTRAAEELERPRVQAITPTFERQ